MTIEIRSDMWASMTSQELCEQRDMVMDKISLIDSIMGTNGINPSYITMRTALMSALATLNNNIDKV